ncbi:MAG: disulfide bond formation protein B [Chromatiales bacterium]|jgi:disulfide bond formation protein DsbB|nr:disulfide bond formation protein B [Chromatiales bacterium]MDX9767180.1 disulfide bond formation protein B [Ectothiorhodospiraceae bacterium]
MIAPSSRQVWLALGMTSAILAAGSLALTAWFDLRPCHLCIFQRLLFMLIAAAGLMAALTAAGRFAGLFVPPLAAAGIAAAGYQSWLQRQPPDLVSCVAGEPGPIERLVEWLGQQAPALFLATGFCEDEALVILGLSLANWALLVFLATLPVAVWALFARPLSGGHP